MSYFVPIKENISGKSLGPKGGLHNKGPGFGIPVNPKPHAIKRPFVPGVKTSPLGPCLQVKRKGPCELPPLPDVPLQPPPIIAIAPPTTTETEIHMK